MAKLKNLYRTGITALALALTLAACNNLIRPELGTSGAGALSGSAIPQGMGTARIRLNPGASARTAVPGMGAYYFTLEFTAPGKITVNEALNGSMTAMVALEPAVWTLEVKGYADSTKTNLKLSGKTSVPITAGTASSFDVYLTPVFNSGGKGSLSYNISFPASARGWFALYPLDDTPGTSLEIDISGTGGNASDTLTDLPEGSYRVVINLYDSAANKSAAWTGAAHIGNGSTTALTRTFTPAGFADCDPPVAADANTLAAKLDAAMASPSGAYTIALDGTETDLGSFTPKILNVTGNKDITVTLKGGGNEVQLGGNGSLFTLGADSGSSLKLALQDITLRGISNNDNSLVRVNDRGSLEMQAGSLITGNTIVTFSDSYGGGVYVAGGTFTMSGGAVSGNASTMSSDSYGGGVSVFGGTFNMSGGAVSNNASVADHAYGGGVLIGGGNFTMSGGTVSSNSNSGSVTSYGSGVYVSTGTFTMSGGVVSGNTASSNTSLGNGVHIYNGTFTMSGGAVVGNTDYSAHSMGVGVFVEDGTFAMSGGAVSGNTTSTGFNGDGGGVYIDYGIFTMSGGVVSDNSANYGGGVYVHDGTFAMSNGEVSGNSAYIDSGFYGGDGGGVYVNDGTFIMSGGAVNGNSSFSSSSISSAYGGGVFVQYGGAFIMSGGVVSGNASSSNGGGVCVFSGTFTMSGGIVSGNILSGGYGREVLINGTFIMSGDARPERVFLDNNTRFITISGPLSGGAVPIDLGLTTSSATITSWENKPVLVLDSSYAAGNLVNLKTYFTLENTQLTASPYTKTPIPGNYTIGNDGKLTN